MSTPWPQPKQGGHVSGHVAKTAACNLASLLSADLAIACILVQGTAISYTGSRCVLLLLLLLLLLPFQGLLIPTAGHHHNRERRVVSWLGRRCRRLPGRANTTSAAPGPRRRSRCALPLPLLLPPLPQRARVLQDLR